MPYEAKLETKDAVVQRTLDTLPEDDEELSKLFGPLIWNGDGSPRADGVELFLLRHTIDWARQRFVDAGLDADALGVVVNLGVGRMRTVEDLDHRRRLVRLAASALKDTQPAQIRQAGDGGKRVFVELLSRWFRRVQHLRLSIPDTWLLLERGGRTLPQIERLKHAAGLKITDGSGRVVVVEPLPVFDGYRKGRRLARKAA